jgi:hypothetical protein
MEREVEAQIVFDDVVDVQPGRRYALTSTGFVWIVEESVAEIPLVVRKAPMRGMFRPMGVRVETPCSIVIASVRIGGLEHLITEISARYLSPRRPENALLLGVIRGDDVVTLEVVAQAAVRLRIALEGRYIDERGN